MVDGLPSLRGEAIIGRLRKAFAQGKDRFGMRLVHYSVQGNHVHCVAEAKGRRALSRGMRGLDIRIARAVNAVLERSGRVLADRYHARALTSPREVRNVLAYVLLNRSRHARRATSACDLASSGACFEGWAEPPELPAEIVEEIARTRASPQTWLLRVGWRRRGLIRLSETPG
jgi:REP element-mobilizing transposase RayT